jgi:N-acyl-D-aspartate/D-glutamate deacylase
MAAQFDLVVRGGTIADGRGGEPYEGDVAISGGRIAAVGRVAGSGRDEIDARGKLVTPGFVDIHTHYDGQVTWDASLLPSANHGVTTVVMGNCGVGFAPCRPQERELLMTLMEGIEDIPLPAMAAGLPWTWESFPEFLDFLDTQRCDVDFATQVPHAALRVYAMGRRGAEREPATAEDIDLMTRVAQEAVEAGALGFSTSRTMNHRTLAGALAPTITAGEDELRGITAGLGAIGKGVIQFIDDFHVVSDEGSPSFAMWRRIVEAAGRPASFTLSQQKADPERWRSLLALVERANDDGLTIRAQISSRAVGSLYSLELSGHPFVRCPAYVAIAKLPLAERVAAMKQPEVCARIIAESPDYPMGRGRVIGEMFAFGDPPDYSPPPESRLDKRAAREGTTVLDLAYDILLEADGHAMLYYPAANFAYGNLDHTFELMSHRDTVIGLGDGGAHVARTCDSSIPSHVLAYWSRDRKGNRLPVGTAVRLITHDTARTVGLGDRGVLAPGTIGDVNVIDYDRLQMRAPVVQHDLPAGGARLVQPVDGYVATVKSGTPTFRDGTSTGAFPGRLVRGSR